EAEDWDSPKRNIRDSGYIDCWESERSTRETTHSTAWTPSAHVPIKPPRLTVCLHMATVL
ncbi:hypothetical protein M9458_028901, partial [Cirrhinus mrigala]